MSARVDACQCALPRVGACLTGSRRSSSSGALLRSSRPLAGAEPWRTRANCAAEQALSMRSAVHALGYCRAQELSTGSGSAHAATPCGEVCACQLSRYAGGLCHPQRSGGSRGKRRHAQIMVGVWKGFTSRNLQRSKWWAAPASSRTRMAPQARHAVARLAGFRFACLPALATRLAYRLAYGPGSREPGWTVVVG